MRTSKYTEEQIIGFLEQAEAGAPVKELCRKGSFSDAILYKWRAKCGSMEAPSTKCGAWTSLATAWSMVA